MIYDESSRSTVTFNAICNTLLLLLLKWSSRLNSRIRCVQNAELRTSTHMHIAHAHCTQSRSIFRCIHKHNTNTHVLIFIAFCTFTLYRRLTDERVEIDQQRQTFLDDQQSTQQQNFFDFIIIEFNFFVEHTYTLHFALLLLNLINYKTSVPHSFTVATCGVYTYISVQVYIFGRL
jgi:hypothetical protein